MKTRLLVGALLVPLISHAGDISNVRVLDREFQEIKVLSTEIELSQFEGLWSKKTKQGPIKVKWLYKLDISEKSKGVRWLYHPDGWIQVLTKQHATTYKISSPEQLNKLLGIHNTSLNRTRAADATLAG